MAKKKKAAPKPVSSSFDAARFRQGEEASMANVPEQAPATSVADEQTRMAATEPVATLALTGAQRAQAAIQDRNQRFQEELAARAASKPTEDPGPGNIWSYNVREGRWKRVFTGAGLGGNTNVGGNFGGRNNGNTGNSSGNTDLAAFMAQQNAAAALAAQQAAATAAENKRQQGQSAYSLLFSEFERFGLGGLVAPLQQFIVDGLSPAEFTLRLRETDAYKKRFAANAQRINKGLRALSEAEYIQLEDQYQNVMRNYGLPANYYQRGDMGIQQGFERFIAGDVSAAELEDRIQTAQNRVINAAPEVSRALREFYPDITGGDILAYALDPDQALTNIKRKIGAAEIGAGAAIAGLGTSAARAEELQRYGVTGEQARQGFQAIAETLPTATKLSNIYSRQGLGGYDQALAEQEAFALAGAPEATARRRKLVQTEQAQFAGTSGAAGGALARERAGQF